MKNILYILYLLFCISCTTVKYVPQETVKKEYITVHTVDTIMQNTTTTIKDKGDTVYIEVDRYIYKYRNKVDTCIVRDTTTVTVYVDKVEYVEVNKIKDWQTIFMLLGGVFIGILVLKFTSLIKKWWK